MKEITKDKLEKIAVSIVMIPLAPVAIMVGFGMWLVDKYFLTDEDRYQLGKKW